MSQNSLKLSEIFKETDTIAYGPFALKNLHQRYDLAEFTVHGAEIKLMPQEKKLMALLISLKGEYLTRKMYDDALDSEKISSPKKIQIYVSSIRKRIAEQLKGTELEDMAKDFQKYFESANPVRSEGEQGKEQPREMYGAYRLAVPTLQS